jgi:hypothetical protein
MYSLKASAVASDAVCSRIYGQPDPEACRQLLQFRSDDANRPQGIAWTDAGQHCFSLAHISRPANCTRMQWQNRVSLPKFWSNAGCKAALLPLKQLIGDVGVYHDDWRHIGNIGSNIRGICMLFDGVPTVPLGGYRSAGNNQRLVSFLYAPYSVYDQEVLDDKEADRPIVAAEQANGLPIPADTVNLPVPNAIGREPVTARIPPTPPKPSGPLCGQSCAGPAHLCDGKDGCICIADAFQGTGSKLFTGKCERPLYSWQRNGNGRGLSEVGFNSTTLSNSTGLLPSLVPSLANITMACPCNCTYVSEACCFSNSGVVQEAASLKLGVLEPPDSQTFCNKTTGDFQTAN